MGVEMTLLRALAFHPRMPLPEPEAPRQSFAPVAPTAVMNPTQVPQQPAAAQQQQNVPLSDATSQVLAARSQLQRAQGATKPKKSEPAAASRARPVNNAALERLASVLRTCSGASSGHLRWKKRQRRKKRIAGKRPILLQKSKRSSLRRKR